MDILEFRLAQRVVFGKQALDEVGRLSKELGGRRLLLVTDPRIVQAGHVERALCSFRKQNLTTFLFDAVEENPTSHQVEDGCEFAQNHAPVDLIIALGGGSPMDCAKGINLLLTNGGRMRDYQEGKKASHHLLPSIGIPTTAGTGSEAQSFALIIDEKTHRKVAYGDPKLLFRRVILDPALTETVPRKVAAMTGMDAIAHALESYVSTRRNPISQMFAREAWQLLENNFSAAVNEPHDLQARTSMLWGAYFAGTAIENSMLGAAHACANPLTTRFGLTHGTAVALMLPHVIKFNGPVVESHYADLLPADGSRGGSTNRLGQRVEQLRRLGDLPERLRDCQVEAITLPELAQEARFQWTAKFNPKPLTERDFLGLYRQAY